MGSEKTKMVLSIEPITVKEAATEILNFIKLTMVDITYKIKVPGEHRSLTQRESGTTPTQFKVELVK